MRDFKETQMQYIEQLASNIHKETLSYFKIYKGIDKTHKFDTSFEIHKYQLQHIIHEYFEKEKSPYKNEVQYIIILDLINSSIRRIAEEIVWHYVLTSLVYTFNFDELWIYIKENINNIIVRLSVQEYEVNKTSWYEYDRRVDVDSIKRVMNKEFQELLDEYLSILYKILRKNKKINSFRNENIKIIKNKNFENKVFNILYNCHMGKGSSIFESESIIDIKGMILIQMIGPKTNVLVSVSNDLFRTKYFVHEIVNIINTFEHDGEIKIIVIEENGRIIQYGYEKQNPVSNEIGMIIANNDLRFVINLFKQLEINKVYRKELDELEDYIYSTGMQKEIVERDFNYERIIKRCVNNELRKIFIDLFKCGATTNLVGKITYLLCNEKLHSYGIVPLSPMSIVRSAEQFRNIMEFKEISTYEWEPVMKNFSNCSLQKGLIFKINDIAHFEIYKVVMSYSGYKDDYDLENSVLQFTRFYKLNGEVYNTIKMLIQLVKDARRHDINVYGNNKGTTSEIGFKTDNKFNWEHFIDRYLLMLARNDRISTFMLTSIYKMRLNAIGKCYSKEKHTSPENKVNVRSCALLHDITICQSCGKMVNTINNDKYMIASLSSIAWPLIEKLREMGDTLLDYRPLTGFEWRSGKELDKTGHIGRNMFTIETK